MACIWGHVWRWLTIACALDPGCAALFTIDEERLFGWNWFFFGSVKIEWALCTGISAILDVLKDWRVSGYPGLLVCHLRERLAQSQRFWESDFERAIFSENLLFLLSWGVYFVTSGTRCWARAKDTEGFPTWPVCGSLISQSFCLFLWWHIWWDTEKADIAKFRDSEVVCVVYGRWVPMILLRFVCYCLEVDRSFASDCIETNIWRNALNLWGEVMPIRLATIGHAVESLVQMMFHSLNISGG